MWFGSSLSNLITESFAWVVFCCCDPIFAFFEDSSLRCFSVVSYSQQSHLGGSECGLLSFFQASNFYHSMASVEDEQAFVLFKYFQAESFRFGTFLDNNVWHWQRIEMTTKWAASRWNGRLILTDMSLDTTPCTKCETGRKGRPNSPLRWSTPWQGEWSQTKN